MILYFMEHLNFQARISNIQMNGVIIIYYTTYPYRNPDRAV